MSGLQAMGGLGPNIKNFISRIDVGMENRDQLTREMWKVNAIGSPES